MQLDEFCASTLFEQLTQKLSHVFARTETRKRAAGYVRALLSQCQRKNGWQVAEWLGDASPDGVQYLLARDANEARDVLREWVIEQVGASDAILILDETGFIKKGKHSAGVQRQYSGTAGRVENCQIGVFLCYSGKGGSAFIDRELYLPKPWIEERERCQQAGIPDEACFASKPELAKRMLERAFAAGISAGWVSGDTVYGGNRRLRQWLWQGLLSLPHALRWSDWRRRHQYRAEQYHRRLRGNQTQLGFIT